MTGSTFHPAVSIVCLWLVAHTRSSRSCLRCCSPCSPRWWPATTTSQGRLLSVHARAETIVRNIERIRFYDEALTGSARLAASTGDRGYEDRYHRLAPELDAVIAQTLRVVNSQAGGRGDRADQRRESGADRDGGAVVRARRTRAGSARRARCSARRSTCARRRSTPQGFKRAATIFRAEVQRSTAHVRRYRPISLGIGDRRRAASCWSRRAVLPRSPANASGWRRRTRAARTRRRERRAAEIAYFESQQHFSEILQVTRREPEAHRLIKRHLERSIPGRLCRCSTATTPTTGSRSMTDLAGRRAAAPIASSASSPRRAPRSGSVAPTGGATRPSLLECEICGALPGASLCTPSLVGGEVIGTVLVQRDRRSRASDERRVLESVSQAAPVLANLRTSRWPRPAR